MRGKKRMRMRCFILGLGGGIGLLSAVLSAQTISVGGQWTLSIGLADLPGGAPGEALPTSYTSTEGVVTLSFNTGGGLFNLRNYRIDVRRQDATWVAGWTLWVRRTSGGFIWGTMNGGTTFQAITSVDQAFVSGRAWIAINIPLQYQLSGFSTTEAAGTYATTVIYTITAW